MSLQDYLSLQDQMSGSIADQIPQLYDKVNDAKVFKKSTEEAFGNIFSVGALTSGIKKLKSSKGILDKLNLSSEELDSMSSDLEAGNYQDVLGAISKKGIKAASDKLTQAIQKMRGIEPRPEEPPQEPQAPEPEIPKPTVEETSFAEPTPKSLNDAVRSADNEPVTQEGADDLAEKFASSGSKDLAGEEDAGKVIGDLLKGSVAEDENPVGLAITAVLGIGSLIAGGLTHTHHETFMKPPPGPIKGFSTQIGAGI